MLDCERWTLTHSSGGAVVLLLPLPLVAGLGSELAATWAASVAGVELVVVALALLVALALVVALALLVGLALLVALAVVVALGVPDGDADADRDGEFVWPGPPLTPTGGGNRVGGVLAAAE
jgi:O-antigen ligase